MNKNIFFKTLAVGFATSFILMAVSYRGHKTPIQTNALEGVIHVEVKTNESTNLYEYYDGSSAWNAATGFANANNQVKMIFGINWEHDSQLILATQKNLTIDLNGHYIKRTRDKKQINNGSVFRVEKDATLTIMDSNPDVLGYDGVKGGVITGGASGNCAGGIHIEENGHVIWQGGTLYDCNTDYHGGGFYVDGSNDGTTLTMTGGRIYSCQTIDSSDNCHGGAIYVKNGKVDISNVTIDSCYSEDYGGGIYIDDGYVNVSNTIFSANYAKDYGGAVYLAGDALINFKDCIFAGNKVDDDGGALYINNNPSKDKNTSFFNIEYPATIFSGCIFRNNSAGDIGGAIFIDDDNVALIDVTIENNIAKTAGGGVWVDSLSDITFKGKCIVNNNICTDNPAFRNVTLQKGIASQAYVYSAGLTSGSYIGINSSSGSNDIMISLSMSKYQMQYFHADDGTLVMRDEHEEHADMVVTASLFGNGILWVSVGIGVAGIGVAVFVIVRRKKIIAKTKTEEGDE